MRFRARIVAATILPVVSALVVFGWAARQAAARDQNANGNGAGATANSASAQDPRLEGAYRFTDGGWIYVHLQGTPSQVGFQHGFLLAPEIQDAFRAVQLEDTHSSHKDWAFFREAARQMLWPKIAPEYQAELEGIVEGLHAHGVTSMDWEDVVALNAFMELPGYYVPWYDARHQKEDTAPGPDSFDHCSAFVATGSYTKNHDIVMAHNNWTSYVEGERWRILFDIVPEHGYRMLMDGFPGVIASDDDFGINSDGLMVTETTISDFHGWDPNGIPEFERARKALQYAGSIDDYVRIMNVGNNGGYANDWLLGDRKTGEIARFEEGLLHTRVWRTKDGYFVGSNFPSDPEVTRDETTFEPNDPSNSANARHERWKQLMAQYKGQIDIPLAEKFEGDDYDAYEKKIDPDERTLCGHIDNCPRGRHPHEPFGAVQGKVTDSELTARMELIAHLGHPDGESFYAQPFFVAHPAYDWEKAILRDMPSFPWTPVVENEHKGSTVASASPAASSSQPSQTVRRPSEPSKIHIPLPR